MKKNDSVKFLRDFPRLSVRHGDQAIIVDEKGNNTYEVSFYSTASQRQESLIVLAEWISLPQS